MAAKYVITYGDLDPRTCELHGGTHTRFGTLIDPNGHKWVICADCINTLWNTRQETILSEDAQAERDSIIDAAMLKLRESLFGPSDG